MIHRDSLSGSARPPGPPSGELLALAAAAVTAALAGSDAAPEALAPALRRVCRAQPTMGAVLRLATRALAVAETAARRGDGPAAAVRAVREALAAFLTDFAAAGESIVARARELVPTSGWVGTCGRSSLVERTLLAASAAGHPLRVILPEGRPLLEGRDLARRLSAAGAPCWLTVDAASALLLPQVEMLILGADAVLPRTFVFRVGAYPLLLAAREHNVPAYALAERARFVPADAPLLELGEREPGEVWQDAPAGVSVRNPTSEEIPLSLVRGVLTEDGILPPGEAGAFAAGIEVPAALRTAWGSLPGEER